MIKFVTGRKGDYYDPKYYSSAQMEFADDPEEFIKWAEDEKWLQLDTETNMVPDGPTQHQDRKLLVIQFGSIDESIQYVVDMIDLPNEWVEAIKYVLSDDITFIAHNARFEYVVIKANLGVTVEDIHDTYLMSKIANTGLDLYKGYHSLSGCLKRHFDIDISKAEQTSFDGSPLTIEQIQYAAIDVIKLYALYKAEKELLESWDLYWLYDNVERQVLKVYGDMELTDMRFDANLWNKLSTSFIKDAQQIEKELNQLVLSDDKLVKRLKNSKKVLGINLIQDKDEYKMNWASITFKKMALKRLVPSLPDDVKTKPDIKKFLKEGDRLNDDEKVILQFYMDRNYDKLNELLINNHEDFLEDNGFYVRENSVLINWASPQHKLYVFQHYYPKLEDTNAKSLIRIKKNPLINKFKEWTKANKNVTSYGENFMERYVKPGNFIAPYKCNQILHTGRISFGILLQIPAENRFRNAFLPPFDDYVFVDTDYSSMEMMLMAYAAGEDAFLDAIREDKDLHSMSASLLFPDEWKEKALPDCEHLKTGKRCKCPEHGKLRTFSKTISFGLAYGLSEYGLAERLDISKTEGKEMMDKFFETFPNLKAMFDESEKFAIDHQYIVGLPPTKRIRFFHYPVYDSDTKSIGRQGKNFKIQEANASILKIALIKLREEIRKNDLPFFIHLPIHDEILSSAPADRAEELKDLQERVMIEASEMFVGKGLTKVDSKISKVWEK